MSAMTFQIVYFIGLLFLVALVVLSAFRAGQVTERDRWLQAADKFWPIDEGEHRYFVHLTKRHSCDSKSLHITRAKK